MINKKLNFGDKITWVRPSETVKAVFLYENAAGCMVEGRNVQGYADRKDLFWGWRRFS